MSEIKYVVLWSFLALCLSVAIGLYIPVMPKIVGIQSPFKPTHKDTIVITTPPDTIYIRTSGSEIDNLLIKQEIIYENRDSLFNEWIKLGKKVDTLSGKFK